MKTQRAKNNGEETARATAMTPPYFLTLSKGLTQKEKGSERLAWNFAAV
jgi:hypothetical protein